MIDDLTQRPANLADPAVLIAATLYLMTRYQEAPCGQLALAVACHLEMLAASAAAPKLRELCDGLTDRWHVLSREAAPGRTQLPRTLQ
ncbi:MAG TPA: hypothetical protein VMN79_05650 [Casimicrobiaceae bacterium]|nr:hypothetical protein [Casimicrobiaceae bacterium]